MAEKIVSLFVEVLFESVVDGVIAFFDKRTFGEVLVAMTGLVFIGIGIAVWFGWL